MKIRKLIYPMSAVLLCASAALISLAPVHAEEEVAPPLNARMAEFTPDRIQKGRTMYKQLCLRCHGPEMVGGNNAFDLRMFPLHDRDRFFNSVTNGKRAMPPWKGILTDEDIAFLWSYVGSRGGTL